jgi:hypothetical protein
MKTTRLASAPEGLRPARFGAAGAGRSDAPSSGLTQNDLATKINEKVEVVNSYETGFAIPNSRGIRVNAAPPDLCDSSCPH